MNVPVRRDIDRNEALQLSGWVTALCVLGAVAMLLFAPQHTISQAQKGVKACQRNLAAIQQAKSTLEDKDNLHSSHTPKFKDLSAILTAQRAPFPLACPRGGKYTIGRLGEEPTCTYTHKLFGTMYRHEAPVLMAH